ncbi:bifunctional metallophosphatase/5'-nucleotidase [bacterium]|nr:bifunctional metallophosphatase/5'-nucleotidase [bacterium]
MQINFLGTKINTLFYNDLHGSTVNIDSFLEAQNNYYKNHQNQTNLTLSGGDVFVTTNKDNETVAKKLCTQTDAIALGNHDIESGNYLADLIKKFALKGKMLSANLLFRKESEMEKAIAPSTIIEKNGEQIGVIGISPFNFRTLCFTTKENEFFDVKPFDETVEIIKKEVENLTSKGINKIFLLAHTGISDESKIEYYQKLAQIAGIDVIIGGHDHLQIDEWMQSENGEPVKVASTGKSKDYVFRENLDTYGILELDFDDNGVLIKENTKTKFERIEQKEEEDTSPIVAKLDEPVLKGNILYGNSEVGNIVSDAQFWYVNKNTKGDKADFAFVNAGTIRADLKKAVTEKNIQQVVPFVSQKFIKATLTKKQVINTLNWCALSTTFQKVTPGVMQVANMTYEINPDNTVSNVLVYDENGNIKYNLDELDDDFEFSVVYDDFLATGVAGLVDLKKDVENDESIEIFNVTRQQALKEYLTNGEIKEYRTPRIKFN